MVHRRKGRKFNRTASHRRALLANLSIALILNKRIKTTEAKAKELRRFIEPLVTKAKRALSFQDTAPEKGIHLRRVARKFLNNKEALIILFDEIGAKVGDRPGGFTRVLKTGNRYGDGARTAIIEFVDYNYIKEREAKTETTETADTNNDKKSKSDSKKKDTKTVKAKEVKTETQSKKKTVTKQAKESKSADVKAKDESDKDTDVINEVK
ncbi:MAG TPA: 50S ribosomal protein L17 [Ignavibacteria bacterium]|nr:50S ribosomal protein L17 [Ignavibacteria bacterium]HRB00345.1 50S ribosomal protein L17 [Ignavibacteria bacterium]